MICPVCEKEGKLSQVNVGLSMVTLAGHIPYYDEKGLYHDHDPNYTTTEFNCSNGHKFTKSYKSVCPNCNYGSNKEKIQIIE